MHLIHMSMKTISKFYQRLIVYQKIKKRIGKGLKVVEGFTYTSDNNDEWMDNKTLLNWLESNINKIGAI